MAKTLFKRLARGVVVAACVCLCGCGGGGEAQQAAISQVTIDTTPEQGAAIIIDGASKGVSPVTLQDLAPGFYEVIAKKDKFEDGYDKIQVKGGVPESFQH
jgi:hypothetical protein